jgi:hypothetical protein
MYVLAVTALLAGCMDKSLPPPPEGVGDLRDDFARAITAGDEAKVNELLNTEPLLLNEPHPVGTQYPLHVAAASGNAAMVKLLLDKGAIPSVQNDEGEYPADKGRFAGLDEATLALLQPTQ